jgi:hypothetical protein
MLKNKTPAEAVIFGLVLALSAPTEADSQSAALMTEELAVAAGLTLAQVDACKAIALAQWQAQRRSIGN